MKEGFAYTGVGILTTLVNALVFWVALKIADPLIANLLAWIVAVVFAYGANAKLVFGRKVTRSGFRSFCLLRLASLGLENALFALGLWLNGKPLPLKAAIAVVTVVANYVGCRKTVFRKEDSHAISHDHRPLPQ